VNVEFSGGPLDGVIQAFPAYADMISLPRADPLSLIWQTSECDLMMVKSSFHLYVDSYRKTSSDFLIFTYQGVK